MNSKLLSKFRSANTKGEPQTMEGLLSKYGNLVQGYTLRQRIRGKIVSINSKRVLINIGGKSEGLVAEKAYKEAQDYIKTLAVGDEVEGVVLVPENPEGYTVLSLRQAAQKASWGKIETAYKTGKSLKVEVRGVNPSGIVVDVDGLNGFIPTSQLGREVAKNPQALIGDKIEVKVVDFDENREKIILSEKEVSEADVLENERGAMKDIKEGDEFEGEVATIYDFGCFVRINAALGKGKAKKQIPLEGLVHVSELSWDKVEKPENVVSVGDKVKVKVIGKTNGKLALSMKQIRIDPWEEADKKYKKDERFEGTVVKISDFGVFVQLEPGIEGLIHMTKIPPGKKFSDGQKVNVYIEDIDTNARKISLGPVLTEKPVGYK